MNLELTEEQSLIRASAEAIAGQIGPLACPPEREAESWRALAEGGWLGMALPEDAGGMAMDAVATMLFCRALGAERVLSPFRMGALVAGRLIQSTGTGGTQTELLRQLVSGDRRFVVALHEHGVRFTPDAPLSHVRMDDAGLVLNGAKCFVPVGADSDAVLLPVRIDGDALAILLVDLNATGVTAEPFVATDGSSAMHINFADAVLSANAMLARGTLAERALADALDFGSAALCAEMVGVMDRMIRQTREYLVTRKQFDAPIAGFQAIQHRIVDMTLEYELAASAAMNAAAALDAKPDDRARRISLARIQCSHAGQWIGRQAVQLFGGMGMTQEVEIGWLLKRLLCLDVELGDSDYHYGRCS
ncbi:acyl-CoA dehydrogenase family protein [Sphingosinithalassobacter portus]|uniref:acyl-CoA dehydrogenase family protein n=1 Tax=Stakelama portus TaxID=2676234 RepID=UPI000D6E91EF|nr:acyl-CoA dehydrogenase family protein [Sphingosinithalassobacter portus]